VDGELHLSEAAIKKNHLQQLHGSVTINAPTEKVWNTMLGRNLYLTKPELKVQERGAEPQAGQNAAYPS
jgi:hypothetical protein